MSDTNSVGLGDIAIYVPSRALRIDRLISHRLRTLDHMARHYERAVRTTGQRVIRFPQLWEDAATMAAAAASRLLRSTRRQARSDTSSTLRYLLTGTESALDFSKPLSAYVQGMLADAQIPLPSTIASFQVQHACAGATAALISLAALIAASRVPDETGIVVASDIARYEAKSTAELTQGAGAAAVLVERNPRLLRLDPGMIGFFSEDVDDFFRPIGSVTARVKGQFSMSCYRRNLEGAFHDYAERHGTSPAAVLRSSDYFVLHAPFRNMPAIALEKTVATELGMDAESARAFLADRRFYEQNEVVAEIGNTYTASVFIVLATLLQNEYRRIGCDIVGKSVLIASYGSGNTMIVFRAEVAAGAPEIISAWGDLIDLPSSGDHLQRSPDTMLGEYERWMNRTYSDSANDTMVVPEGDFYLQTVRNDGYRVYKYARTAVTVDHRLTDATGFPMSETASTPESTGGSARASVVEAPAFVDG